MSERVALRLAIRVLQHLAVYSRCWSSRQVALLGLRAIGLTGAVDLNGEVPERIVLAPEERPDRVWPGDVGNYSGMWGPE